MKKPSGARTLRLSSETLRILSGSMLQRARGAADFVAETLQPTYCGDKTCRDCVMIYPVTTIAGSADKMCTTP